MTVRRATPGDAAAIARIHVAGWQVGYRGLFNEETLDALSVEQHETDWIERLEGGTVTWVAGEPVASFLGIAPNEGDDHELPGAANIGALYTDPGAWGRGHGAALLDTAIDWIRANGYERVTLWAVVGNERAIGFYERRGFRADGAIVFDEERGAPEQRMVLELRPDPN